ncbi:hypothetical protein BBJ28_00013622 [Nothophytophthora sp. Chile5]|nr:hypothetical protein BBJ28_00013622 [Nothophytophthora sp. Chile5]
MEDAHEDAAGDASSADGSGDWEQEQQEEGEGCGLGEECGLADAFEQFEARVVLATSRSSCWRMGSYCRELTRSVYTFYRQQLFEVKQTDATRDSERSEDSEPMADNVPSYIYMSDHFRLTKPPQFQFWQSNFPYLEVAGSALILDESTEHIQCIPMETSDPNPVAEEGNHDHGVLRVDGRACLQEPSQETQALYEEIILCDGFMEETLAEHTDEDEETDDGCFIDAVSPGAARFDEVVDSLTMECFSSTVVPLVSVPPALIFGERAFAWEPVLTFYVTALEIKQQRAMQSAREEVEAALIREAEEQIALQQARRLQLEQEVREEVARIEALDKANQPEERREAERRELLLKQQLAKSEAEEEKVKTLATYLKPVLQAKVPGNLTPNHVIPACRRLLYQVP